MSSRTLRLAAAALLGALVVWALWTVGRDPTRDRRRPGMPRRAPDFRLATLSGPDVWLKALRGKGVLVVFWSGDAATLPLLTRLQERYGGDHFQIVAIVEDASDAVRALARSLPFPVAADPEGVVAARHHVDARPTSIFVDPDGNRAGRVVGPLDEKAASEAVERLVAAARAKARKTVIGSPPKG